MSASNNGYRSTTIDRIVIRHCPNVSVTSTQQGRETVVLEGPCRPTALGRLQKLSKGDCIEVDTWMWRGKGEITSISAKIGYHIEMISPPTSGAMVGLDEGESGWGLDL